MTARPYSAPSNRWSGTAVLFEDTPIAFARGDDLDAPKTATMIAEALNSFTPEAVRLMRVQLATVRYSMERARDCLTFASEVIPADDLADDCQMAAGDAVEGLWFIDQVLLALPPVDPNTAEDAKALADARIAARPPKIAVLVQDGRIEQIISTKPMEAVIVDHDVDELAPAAHRVFHWDDGGKVRVAEGYGQEVEVDAGCTINFFAEVGAIEEGETK